MLALECGVCSECVEEFDHGDGVTDAWDVVEDDLSVAEYASCEDCECGVFAASDADCALEACSSFDDYPVQPAATFRAPLFGRTFVVASIPAVRVPGVCFRFVGVLVG